MKALALAALVACAAAPPPATYASVNGLHMYYEEHGSGPPLVLLHGGGSTAQTSFGALIPRLEKDHRIIAPEQQAHGHTADIDRPLSFAQMADDTDALLEQLGIHDADVLGFSNGGAVALQLAIRHPSRVRHLIVCSGFFSHAGLIPALRQGLDQPPNAANMPPALRDAYLAASPHPDLERFVAKTVAMMRSFPDVPEDRLREVATPTLVMDGDSDVILPEHAIALAHLVQHGQVAVLPGSLHGAYIGVAESPRSAALLDASVTLIEAFLGH